MRLLRCRAIWLIALLTPSSAFAQEPPQEADLARRQEQIVRRYADFELLLRRMADNLKATDPPRAALLEKSLQQSRKSLIGLQAGELAKALQDKKFPEAIKSHEPLVAEMRSLLDLLLSEDAAHRLRAKRETLEKTLQTISRLRDQQEDLRSQTQRLGDRPELGKLAPPQDKLAEAARRAAESLPSDGPDPKSIHAASQAMQQAAQQLQNANSKNAHRDQSKALANLEKALADLEQVLRQLREEERQQRLASLEEEFRRMLQLQRLVHEGTQALDRIPASQRTGVEDQKALTLAKSERELIAVADRVLLVLHDDGTAFAIPEALEQVRADATTIERLLQKAEVGSYTQGLERDVISALEELLAAVQRELRQSGAPRESRPGRGDRPPPLVEALAELKMIRALQNRINERTARLADRPPSKLPESERRSAFDDLAQRQQRVYQITRAIAAESGP